MGLLDWHRQARLLESLATTLEAGLPPDRCLDLAAAAGGGRPGARARAAVAAVARGESIAAALAAAGEDAMLVAVVAAGERSGRLPPLLRRLAEAYALRARLRDEAAGRLLYPLLLTHLALAVLPLPWVVSGAVTPWMLAAGPVLLWLSAGAAWWSARGAHRTGLLGRLALRQPAAWLCRPALDADLAAVLGAALSSGLLAPDALGLAADACLNRSLGGRLSAAGRDLRAGRLRDVGEALAACGMSADLLALVATAEASGTLDRGLHQVAVVAGERFADRLRWTVRAVTGAIYALAMLIAAATIVTMYAQIYGQALKELDP